MATFVKQKILIIHAQQPYNPYAGGATGQGDSEQYWMRKLGEELVPRIKALGHEVLFSPMGSTYADNVAWVNKQPGADFLISLHSNATATTGDRPVGIGVYHAPTSTKGAALARSLAPYLTPASATGKTYVSTLTVAELTQTYPPALLVEHEFHDWEGSTTTGGSNWLRHAPNRTRICDAYVKWITDKYGALVPETPEVTPPPEVVTPPLATETLFRFGMAAQVDPRFGGSTNYLARGVAMKTLMKCSIYTTTETNSAMRAAILSVLGPAWKVKVHSAGSVANFYDGNKWEAKPGREVDFGDRYHGALCTPLVSKASGIGFDLIGVHVRPKSVASPAQKEADVREALTLIKSWPVLFAGDFSMNPNALCLEKGLVRATPNVDTYDAAGDQRIDAVFIKKGGRIVVRGSKIVNPGVVSDHKWPLGQMTLKAPVSSL